MTRILVWSILLAVTTLGCQEDSTGSAEVDMAMVASDANAPADSSPQPVDGGVESMDGTAIVPDMGDLDPCSDEALTDYLSVATEAEDGTYATAGEYSGRNDFTGSCGGEGNDRAYRFTAPRDGLWVFTIESEDESLDSVLHARSDCAEMASELDCNDDTVPGQTLLSQLRFTLSADQTVYIFVDAYGGAGAAFQLVAREIPVVALGEACDPQTERNGCAQGAFCRVDPDSGAPDGLCAPDEPPVLNEVLAYRNGNTLQLQINGSDSGGDVDAGRLQLYQGNERIVLDPEQGADTFIMTPIDSVFGQTEFAYRYRADVFDSWPDAIFVRVMLVDGQSNESDWSQIDIRDATVAADRCDQFRILDACTEGRACLDPDDDGIFNCSLVTAPTIRTAKGYYDSESRLIGFEITGDDPDRDVTDMRIELIGADGMGIASGELAYDRVTYPSDQRYAAVLSFCLADDFGFTQVRVQSIDREGLRSDFRDLPALRGPRDVGADDACDPLGARARCEDGLYCFADDTDAEPTCGLPPEVCPEMWGDPILYDTSAVGESWRQAGTLAGRPNRISGSCGGGSAQAIYEFTAPAAGTYSILANGTVNGADPIVYARSHCRFDGVFTDFELGCNDNHGRITRDALIRVELTEGQRIYVFVDGAAIEGGTWQGPFDLVIRRLP
jgi:hypothetical protein